MDIPAPQLLGRIKAIEGMLLPGGTAILNVAALSWIDESNGVITVTSDLHLDGTFYGAGGNIAVGDNLTASGKTISATQLTAGGVSTSASVGGTTGHFTNNLGSDAVLSGNQVLAAGISTSASVGGTTAHFTNNVGVDTTLVANQVLAGGAGGSSSVAGTTGHFTSSLEADGGLIAGSSGQFTVDTGGNIDCNGINQTATTTNNLNGPLVIGTTGSPQSLTVHGDIHLPYGTIPQASTSFPTIPNNTTLPGLHALGSGYVTDIATISSVGNVLNQVVQALNNAGVFF
jgi:hypothetical protein